ncbi:MAG: proprotein convertase P-domain-containing protein, partial [Acidobacteriota bacterium]
DGEPEGVCRVSEAPYSFGSDNISYFCDSEGGSSGSPIISALTHRVVALHHTASTECRTGNHGVRMDLIYPEIAGLLPACSFAPDLVWESQQVHDGPGIGNSSGFADPGETIRLSVSVRNRGTSTASAVSGVLSTTNPLVTVTDDTAAFPDIADGAVGATLDPHFELAFSSEIACGTRVPLRLDLTTAQGSFALDLELEVGENFGGAVYYTASDVPQDIPDYDPTGIRSTIDVPDNFTLVDVFVQPLITHTYAGDLTVDLTSPANTTVRLHAQTGWSRDGLDDDYDRDVPADGPGAMSDFDLENSAGTWTLDVVDNGPFDWGSLDAWTLELHQADDFVCQPLGGPSTTPGEPSWVQNGAAPLLVTGYDPGSGQVSITFDTACDTADTAAYSGSLAGVASYAWDDVACGLGTSGSASFNPGAGSRFFVIVGQSASAEGSYGRSSAPAERPEASGFGACDLPQDLSNACDR